MTSHDGKPVAKVIDFGVAKAIHQQLTEQTIYTNFAPDDRHAVVHEPRAGGDERVGHRHALGHLLAGRVTVRASDRQHPLEKKRFAKAAYDEIRRLIREEEPPKPSQRLSTSETLPSLAASRKTEPAKLSRMLKGELDWVVMKALEKDRTRRYETANGLARDIQSYLSDEVVEARPPTTGYRLRKFARKNRAAITTAVAIAMLLVAGVAISAWQAIRAMRAETVAIQEQKETEAARKQAVAQTVATQEALEQVTNERKAAQIAAERAVAAEKKASNALDALTDDVIKRVFSKQPKLGKNERDFLRRVRDFYEAPLQQTRETAESRAFRANGFFKVATIQHVLGELNDAEIGYRKSIAIYQQLTVESPGNIQNEEKLATGLCQFGELLLQRELTISKAKLRESSHLWSKLAASSPQPPYRLAYAQCLRKLGLAMMYFGVSNDEKVEVASLYSDSQRILSQLVGEYPQETTYRYELALTLRGQASLAFSRQRVADAEHLFRAAIKALEEIVRSDSESPQYLLDVGLTYTYLAEVLSLRDRSEAIEALLNSHALLKQLVADYPQVGDYRIHLGECCYCLGSSTPRSCQNSGADTAMVHSSHQFDGAIRKARSWHRETLPFAKPRRSCRIICVPAAARRCNARMEDPRPDWNLAVRRARSGF